MIDIELWGPPLNWDEDETTQANLIDSLLPESLPLYINYEWASNRVEKRFVEKLRKANIIIEFIEKIKSAKPFDISDIEF